MSRLPCLLVPCALFLVLPSSARAADANDTGEMSREEIEAWLDARAVTDTRDVSSAEAPAEVPPPPPRHRGLVLESSVGALGHVGPLADVSPVAPWFRLHFGYEVFDWLMVFGEGDLAFSSTSRANPPPEPRAYALYGFGGGMRFSVELSERIGVHAQGSVGGARVSDDVLRTYGFDDAHELNPYFGARLGLDWYQVNPHYALVFHANVRSYPTGLERIGSSAPPLALMGALALRYAF